MITLLPSEGEWLILAGVAVFAARASCHVVVGVFKLKTQSGTIVVAANLPADAEVFVDGHKSHT